MELQSGTRVGAGQRVRYVRIVLHRHDLLGDGEAAGSISCDDVNVVIRDFSLVGIRRGCIAFRFFGVVVGILGGNCHDVMVGCYFLSYHLNNVI